MRKGYVIAFIRASNPGQIEDLLWLSNCKDSRGVQLKPEDMTTINNVELHDMLVADAKVRKLTPVKEHLDGISQLAHSMGVHSGYEDYHYGIINRRALAREALAQARSYWATYGYEMRLLEVGGFNRNVRPVKHWNITRQYRYVTQVNGKLRPDNDWSDPVTWLTGIPLREDAREQARELTADYNKGVLRTGEQFKYLAVPVYAD